MLTEETLATMVLLAVLSTPVIGVAIRMILRLAYGARGPKSGDSLYRALNVLAWLLIALGVLVWSLTTTFGVFVLGFIAIAALLDYVRARRALQRNLAWTLVSDAQERGQDVASVVRLQIDRFSGVIAEDLKGFAWQLDHGDSLPTAVGIWHKAFPREAQGYAALGKQDGRLAIELPPSYLVHHGESSGILSYLAWVLLLFFGFGVFGSTQLVPAFEAIFLDFSITLPTATQYFFDLSSVFNATGIGMVLLLLFLLAVLLFLISVLCYLLDIPIWRWWVDRWLHSQRRADVLRLLAVAIERQMPLAKAMQHLALGHPRFPTRRVAKQLGKAFRVATTGVEWKDALVKARLLQRSEKSLLNAAEAAGNLPWALRALADRLSARSWFRWRVIQQASYPIAIGLVGLLVLWYSVAMFLPLVKLIGGLA